LRAATHASEPGGFAAQLFRLAKSARGADADALEIYQLSASQVVEA